MPERDGDDRLTRAIDATVDAALIAFALWTVAYHLAIVVGAPVALTTVAWLVATVAVLAYAARGVRRSRAAVDEPLDDVRVVWPLELAGALFALAGGVFVGRSVATHRRWSALEAAVALVMIVAIVVVWRARPISFVARRWMTRGPAIALLVALTFGVAALVVVRPDADDVLLLNRSVWIEHRGSTFPERDTLFSDQRFVSTRPENPSPAIEPLVGVIARYTPLSAPSVAYFVIAPAVSFLAALALWRLLRELHATLPWLALLASALFLAFDGAVHTSFGNFAFARAWQGKVALVFLVVPLLWRHALAWGRTGRRRDLVVLVAANVAAVGFSTTALFVAPPITVLGVLAALPRRGGLARVPGLVLALVYPIAGGLFALVAARQPLTVALASGVTPFFAQVGKPAPVSLTTISPWVPWYALTGTGAVAAVAAIAALGSWLATRDRASRLALLGAPLAFFGVLSTPFVLHLLRHIAPSAGESVLWRVAWIVPVPAMVGVLATGVLARFGARTAIIGALAGVAAIGVVCAATGTAVWSHDNGAFVTWHPRWKVAAGDRAAASRLLALSRHGDVVAAPIGPGGVIAMQSVDVRVVDPRADYLTGRNARTPAFHAADRAFLASAVTNGIHAGHKQEFVDALSSLSVDVVCTRPGLARGTVGSALRTDGYAPAGSDPECDYWRRANH